MSSFDVGLTRWLQRSVLAATCMLVACGGKVVVDAASGSRSTDGAAGGAPTTSGAGAQGAGGSTTSTTSTTQTTGSCDGKTCGAFCTVCGPDCVTGHCDGAGTCLAESFGDPSQCPPPVEVVQGVACATEALMCASDMSCSGYLMCECGAWTLINPC